MGQRSFLLLCTIRAECEDRLRAEFRIEMNAAVAESEQRWQTKEQELQTKVSEFQAELRKEQLRVSLLHRPAGLFLLLLLDWRN